MEERHEKSSSKSAENTIMRYPSWEHPYQIMVSSLIIAWIFIPIMAAYIKSLDLFILAPILITGFYLGIAPQYQRFQYGQSSNTAGAIAIPSAIMWIMFYSNVWAFFHP